MEEMKIGLVVMASGLGKRFGDNKLMVPLRGKPLVKWIIDTTEGLFYKRIIVTRSKEVKELCENMQLECIYHDLPGRNDTIRLGLSSLMNDVDYCFFATGDQPLISRESIIKLIDKIKTEKGLIVRPSFQDIAGSPVGFHKSFFGELLCLPEGKGGSVIIRKYPDDVALVNVKDEYELWDIDTVEDLERVKNIINDAKI